MAGLQASRLTWVAFVRRATHAWLLRSLTCYLFERAFNLICAVCRKRQRTGVVCSIFGDGVDRRSAGSAKQNKFSKQA
jgi:hypothetical protein